ncbi:putative apoptosis inducing factor [Heterostelium album PN500]|uniref:Putative apoptosis inducing factor n=1 Tax=Heterostelium pallidum (strain ATCC 26659 / Pp 5 / PN500) TaxID=670386 RepID=D3AYP0_HETP5|nr:putative apoptosis inducing factor [Heterostelium album PN500]EFA86067.1 putative apoptosis inducing factor [Heterostelium album PN500]|eukprot:XP_020438173.1 putative apoptosis inducing factor [Heterostelium album PN500]
MKIIYATIFFFYHYALYFAFSFLHIFNFAWKLLLSIKSTVTNRVPVEDRKRVVIVGGGFSGSMVAQKLENDFQVTLVDTKDYFEFTPSILRTIVEPTHIRSIQVLHSHYLKHTNVVQKEVIGVHPREVVTDDRTIPFDYLVINSGSSYNSPFKESSVVASARANTLRENYYHIRKLKKILIIGGGIVGVELAAEIVSHFKGKEVTLIHSQSKLMNRFPKKAIKYSEQYLVDHGVRIVHNERVIAHKGNIFITDQGSEIIADQAFLCTGIVPNSDMMKASFPDVISEFGYIKSNEYLQMAGTTFYRNIYVSGDVLNVREEKLAQTAENTADIVVNNIYAMEARKESSMKQYKSFSKPILISLGKYCAIFVYKDWVFTGFIPALLKEAVEWKTMIRYW